MPSSHFPPRAQNANGSHASSTVARLMAEQPMLTASGNAAIWQGAVSTWTSRASVLPPSAPGPMPVAFTISSSSSSNAAVRSSLERSPTGRRRAVLAKDATLSNVEPTPTPITSGGQAFAAFARTHSMISRTTPSRPAPGVSMTTREALSDPPPFSRTCTRAPGASTK